MIENSLDTPVGIGVQLNSNSNIGITGFIQDNESKYAVDAFLCDTNDVALAPADIRPKGQGGQIRVCVAPNNFTRSYGVAMKQIDSYTLSRGDVTQNVITPDNVIADSTITTVFCTSGQLICSVTTKLSTKFFYSSGTVTGSGEAWLEYQSAGGARHLIKVPIQLQQEDQRMMAIQAGAFIGARPFSFTVQVSPSTEVYVAEAFECDTANNAITNPTPKRAGDAIRVCVEPNANARTNEIYMRGINSFYFSKGDLVQFAVQTGGIQATDGNTLLLCNYGYSLCVFKTILTDNFYQNDNPVNGSGQVYLQYGQSAPPGNRRLTGRIQFVRKRNLQITNSDAAFAGASTVNLTFHVLSGSSVNATNGGGGGDSWQNNANTWWTGTPKFLRVIYVLAIILGVLILLCCLWVFFCGWPRKIREYRKKSSVKTPPTEEQAPEPQAQNPNVVVVPVVIQRNSAVEPDSVDDDRSPEMSSRDPSRMSSAVDAEKPFHRSESRASSISKPMSSIHIVNEEDNEDVSQDEVPPLLLQAPPPPPPPPESRYPMSPNPKSPRRSTSVGSAQSNGIKSPRRSTSAGSAQSNGIKSPRRSTSAGSAQSNGIKSPRRSTSTRPDPNSVPTRSPAPGKRRTSAGGGEEGRQTPRRSVGMDGQDSSHSRRSAVDGQAQAKKSPKPRRPTTYEGDILSPGGRRATLTPSQTPSGRKMDPRLSSRRSQTNEPGSAKSQGRTSVGVPGGRLPDHLPFDSSN